MTANHNTWVSIPASACAVCTQCAHSAITSPYIKFQARKSRRSQVHLWKPMHWALVLGQCVLSVLPEWRAIVERVQRPLLALPTVRVLCPP